VGRKRLLIPYLDIIKPWMSTRVRGCIQKFPD